MSILVEAFVDVSLVKRETGIFLLLFYCRWSLLNRWEAAHEPVPSIITVGRFDVTGSLKDKTSLSTWEWRIRITPRKCYLEVVLEVLPEKISNFNLLVRQWKQKVVKRLQGSADEYSSLMLVVIMSYDYRLSICVICSKKDEQNRFFFLSRNPTLILEFQI